MQDSVLRLVFAALTLALVTHSIHERSRSESRSTTVEMRCDTARCYVRMMGPPISRSHSSRHQRGHYLQLTADLMSRSGHVTLMSRAVGRRAPMRGVHANVFACMLFGDLACTIAVPACHVSTLRLRRHTRRLAGRLFVIKTRRFGPLRRHELARRSTKSSSVSRMHPGWEGRMVGGPG